MQDRSEHIDGKAAWSRLFVTLLLGTIGAIGFWDVIVVLPVVQAEFGVDRADAALPYTLTTVGYALGNVILGRMVDRAGLMKPLMASSLILGMGHLLASLSPTIWTFALIHFAIGFAGACTFGPLMADISHWFMRYRGVAVAVTACGNYLGGMAWPLALQRFIEQEGWRATYAGIGIFVLATMVPLVLLMGKSAPRTKFDPARPASAESGPHGIDLSSRMLQLLLVLAGLSCCVAMAMPQVHIVAYCVDLGYGFARGAEMLSLMLFGGVVSRLASGFLADWIGGVKTALIGSCLQALSLLLYIPFDGLASLYMVSLIFGLSQGGIVPSYAMIVREYLPAREAGSRVGLVIMATLIGMALGGWMSGYIYDLTGSYQAAFLNGIAWNLLNMAVLAFILWRAMRAHRPAAA